MVSDSELVDRLREFLRTSDLNTTTTGIVRRKLEEEFGIDLSEKKVFIREQVDIFLQSQIEKAEADEEEDEEGKREIKSEENNSSSSEDDGDDDEEEQKQASNRNRSRKGLSNKPNKDAKKRGGGFTKVCGLSPQLQKLVGVPEMARTEVVRQLWAYIRENNLQDPSNKRNILCDEKLHVLFSVDSINMFQMNKALSKHIWSLGSEDAAPVKLTPKEKQRKQGREEGLDESKPKEKRQKGGGLGFLAPLQLSDALVKFIGTGESLLSRADVVKRMWEYIKQNNLQDPSNKRQIICDEKLKELFNVDSFVGFTVPKLLAAHFIKTEQ